MTQGCKVILWSYLDITLLFSSYVYLIFSQSSILFSTAHYLIFIILWSFILFSFIHLSFHPLIHNEISSFMTGVTGLFILSLINRPSPQR